MSQIYHVVVDNFMEMKEEEMLWFASLSYYVQSLTYPLLSSQFYKFKPISQEIIHHNYHQSITFNNSQQP